MKKTIVSLLVLSVLVLAGCKTTTDLTTNKVGWSNYADLSVKDYDVVGIVNVESQEVYECGPLGFDKSLKGSRITWSDLMTEAAKMGADDVINIRTEVTDRNNRTIRFLEFFTGYTLTYYYKGTGLAIKYTGSVERGVSSTRIGNSDTLPRSSGPEKEFIKATR